jgi:high-affinity nickel-transport protein
MVGLIKKIFGDRNVDLRGKIVGIFAVVAGLNLLSWTAAFGLFQGHALLLGSAVLAYGLGLRHAVDADHIAAIDNVTRKLMQDGKRPVAAGFFFSMGHSTIVVILSLVLAATAAGMKNRFAFLQDFGGLFGVAVSALVLLVLAAMNVMVLVPIVRTFRRVKNGGRCDDQDLDLLFVKRGFLGRQLMRLFRLVDRSWYMYPIGLLFGLGFDTATEVGLLGLAATEATRGLSVWAIMVFPALFTAGMSMIDTADSVLMLNVYRWSFVKPLRKLYYNLTITAVSVVIAVVVAGIEVLGLVQARWSLSGVFWHAIVTARDNSGMLGIAIVGVFSLSWIASLLIYKIQGYDEIEIKTTGE